MDTAPSLRILCLHNGNSSAEELHEQMQSLDKRLSEKHNVELVYVNSLLHATNNDGGLVWWQEDSNNDEEEQPHIGLDATLLHVRQVLAAMPFSGILACGQGAALASLLPFLVDNLEFSIFVNGKSLLEEQERLVEDWPVLHIVDPNSNDSSQRLIDQFGGQVHESKSPLIDTSALNAIGKFVVEQKKRLLSKCGRELVLQDQLFAVEQEAAMLVAQRAMTHPPPSLVAAIVPAACSKSIVGAWSGIKPYKEGGGAPCPSEFVLTKQERQAQEDKDSETR